MRLRGRAFITRGVAVLRVVGWSGGGGDGWAADRKSAAQAVLSVPPLNAARRARASAVVTVA